MAPRSIADVLASRNDPYSGADLVAAVHRLNSVSAHGGLLVKQEAIHVLRGVAEGIANAVMVLAFDHRHAGYGPEIWEPLYQAGHSFHAAAELCEQAHSSIASLVSMSVSDLATSQRQTPHNTELNGGS
jgi:hypothetical protein